MSDDPDEVVQQMAVFRSRAVAAAAASVLTMLLFGAGMAVASNDDDLDTFTGCLESSGDIYGVDVGDSPVEDCDSDDLEISWNKEGARGVSGGEGPRGARGRSGDDGLDGANGENGADGALDLEALCALEHRIASAAESFELSPSCSARLTDTTPVTAAAISEQGALNYSGLSWNVREPVKRPDVSAPTAPDNSFSDPRAYHPGTEIIDPAVSRPVYEAGIRNAKWLRYLADSHLTGQGVSPDDLLDAAERIDAWSLMDARSSTDGAQSLATGLSVMNGVFLAATDLGIQPTGVDDWVATLTDRLSDRNWRSNHSFRAGAIATLAAALSASTAGQPVPVSAVDLVKDLLNDHVERTLNGDRNTVEDERDRGLHYPLLELNSIGVTTAWLRAHDSDIGSSAAEKIAIYLDQAWPRFHSCASLDPKPGQTPCRYTTSDGVRHTDIGPINKGLWGPSMEWMIVLGFAPDGATIPQGFTNQTSPYRLFGKTPSLVSAG